MKLITLNCWGGKLHEPLLEYFRKSRGTVDIFCLQEVFSTDTDFEFSNGAKMNLLQDIKNILLDHNSFYAPKSRGYDYTGWIGKEIDFGNALFIKKGIPVTHYEELFEAIQHSKHDWTKNALAKAQVVTVEIGGKPLTICNFHGIWINGTEKKDTPERIEQSHHLKKALDAFHNEKILAGDFNLLPDGQSIKILEQGMSDLITEYNITSTRSSLYTKALKYADYILTSPGVQVKNCQTITDEVSDHLAVGASFDV